MKTCFVKSLTQFSTVLVALAGCNVGPEYRSPSVSTKPNWSLSDSQHMQGVPVQLESWWDHFEDPVLQDLIYTTVDQNLTLKQVCARVSEARARRNIAYGNQFPQSQSLNGSYAKTRLSENTANFFTIPGIFATEVRPENWSIGFAAAWELDFWGRYRRAVESADAVLDASVAAYDDAMVILLAEMATAYIELRTFENRIEFARQNLEIQRRTLELSEKKKQGGISSALDVSQAKSRFAQTESVIPVFEIARLQASHRMCLLLGRDPVDLNEEFGYTGSVPQTTTDLSFGVPADLIRRRPDIREAERKLASQSARIGIAESDLYPHISILGNIGVDAENLSDLFQSSSLAGLASPSFSWKILNYGRIRCNIAAERAAFTSLFYEYQNTVKSALREAEDSQAAYVLGYDRIAALERAVDAAADATQKAIDQYSEGKVDIGRVYVLQEGLFQLQDELAVARGERIGSLIALFRSMGGGWEVRLAMAETASMSFATEAELMEQTQVLDAQMQIEPENETVEPLPPIDSDSDGLESHWLLDPQPQASEVPSALAEPRLSRAPLRRLPASTSMR